MNSSRRTALLPALLVLLLTAVPAIAAAPPAPHDPGDPIPSPEDFFGFSMGTSEKLARWERIVEYFELIDANSERVQVTRVGDTTLGNAYLSIAISSPENGCLNLIVQACRQRRCFVSTPYLMSPTTGCPFSDRWTRI